MISAEIDMPKFQRSLKKFSKSFGETNSQAVVRWGVQTCRELAFEAQPWGKKQVKQRQKVAILADLYNVVLVRDKIGRGSKNSKLLKSAGDVIGWMDENRGKGKRTQYLQPSERMICSRRVANAAVSLKMKHAGIAKGSFVGAGIDLAKAQRGQDKIAIGKNYFGYAHKHARFGDSKKPRTGPKPSAKIISNAAHTSKEYVIKKAAMRKAIKFGLKKTVKWYQSALRRQDRKTK